MGAKLRFVCVSKTERIMLRDKRVWDVHLDPAPEVNGGETQYATDGGFALTIYDPRLKDLFSVGESYTADFSLELPS